ncbi:putative transmembrane anti-sigma factor [Hymenobacter roseosalivarius DSM 11622]|uniref:Putative transmembrane anti-sigma factor n=1 Tax=Hymenobacter roseosalivarius DSM 11622 TaxID=645990 RepID=A0A1W1V487_9BACT|nr:zf-HC2 domain-containing protein [Hymenobacter roseosalivarius]SMB88125.1 putative transmembrane anti-sigma factor [Hymenobacter roseosalivarius DSM 11622]
MNSTQYSSECLNVADLLVDYAEHSLPPEQTARIAAHLAHCPRCQQRVAQLRELGGKFEAAEPVNPPPALRVNFMAALEREKAALAKPESVAGEAKIVRMEPAASDPTGMWWLRIAASLLLLATGVLLGNLWRPAGTDVAGVTTATTSDPRFRALKVNPTAPSLSASDRIQLVNEMAVDAEGISDPTVQALINTLNFDPNTNVRLAAGQALYRLRDDPRVGEAFVQSLTIQTDPNVQIMLIELLVALRERRAVPELERLSQRRDALPIVRQQAESGLGQLIQI